MSEINDRESKFGDLSSGYRILWIAVRIKTKRQRAVFDYVYEHPGCTVGDIRKGTEISPNTILHIIQNMREEDILLFEEDVTKRIRHYSVNYELVEEVLRIYREKVQNYIDNIENLEHQHQCEGRSRKRKAVRKIDLLREETAL